MLRVIGAVFLISTTVHAVVKHGHEDEDKVPLTKIADNVVSLLQKTITDLNSKHQLTKEALKSTEHKTEVVNAIETRINSEDLKKNMDRVKRRDKDGNEAPAMIYNKLVHKLGRKLGKEAKEFLKAPVEASVKNYILKQEVAGTPINTNGETSIEELADRVVDILKTVVNEMAKGKQLTKQAQTDPEHKGDVVNTLEEKLNSAELQKNMDRIKARDPTAEKAPELIYNKLIQTVQLGDDPQTAKEVLKPAVESAVKNFIVKQRTIVPPPGKKQEEHHETTQHQGPSQAQTHEEEPAQSARAETEAITPSA